MSSASQSQSTTATEKVPLRFRWSHRNLLHRVMVKTFNTVAGFVPFGIKYGIGKMRRNNRLPYKIIKPGSTIVQIGAPSDTLKAGRSRGMYFCLFNGKKGKTVLIEPADQSRDAFAKLKKSQGRDELIFVHSGAWSERKDLKLYIDPSHPATNFTEGTVDYTPERIAQFTEIVIPCDSVDNLLANVGIEKVDMVSITTNGSVKEILQGMSKLMDNGIEFICLARHVHLGDFGDMMRSYGFEEFGFDDRGTTYRRIQSDS